MPSPLRLNRPALPSVEPGDSRQLALRDDDAAPFVHPADLIDPPPPPPSAHLPDAEERERFARCIGRMLEQCMPTTPYTGERRWRAGYRYWVAYVHVSAPELFGRMTIAQVAAAMEIDERQFRKLRKEAMALLASRVTTASRVA